MLVKATRQHTRDHNSRLVLRVLFERGEISRADLARLTGLTRTTVSEVIGALLERNLVEELGPGASSGGRTPILLRIADNGRLLGGLSLTSSEVSGALFSLRGELLQRFSLPLMATDGELALATLHEAISHLRSLGGTSLLGIGVAVPGLVDPATGVVRRAVAFGWHDLPLGQLLETRHNLPIYVANDSHCAALAELNFGEGQVGRNLLVVRVGRGIGAGVTIEGRLFSGDGLGAGEIGHIVVAPNGNACACGNHGCLETVAALPAILNNAGIPSSAIAEPAAVQRLVVALGSDEPRAHSAVEAAGNALGSVLAHTIGLLNIEQIILTGRAAALGERWRAAVAATARTRALPALAANTSISLGSAEPQQIIAGAAALLLAYEIGLAS